MADEPNDPPIGTAQNAADVARKAEVEELNQTCARINARENPDRVSLPWSEKRIREVFDQVQEYASGPDGQWLEADFIEALEILHGIRSR